MRVVHLTQQGAWLRADGELLLVEADGVLLSRVRLPLLDRLVLHGAIHLSASALAKLFASDCDVVFLTADGRYRGRLERPSSAVATLRAAQAVASVDAARRTAIARTVVRNKLHAQYRVLRAAGLAVPQAWFQAARQVRVLATPAELAGAEGWATRAYFAALRTVLTGAGEGWRRQRRPPSDPVNAVLSYLYALLAARVSHAVLVAGLDPAIGFLHGARRGRPSLVLDLMEEFRPLLADWTALRLLRRLGSPETWSRPDEKGGIRLSDDARRAVIQAFEERLRRRTKCAAAGRALPWDEVIQRQADELANVLRGRGSSWRPVWPAGGRRPP